MQNVPTSSLLLLMLPTLSVVGVTDGRERADPRSLVEGLKSAESLFSCSAVCSCLCCVPPFIKEGEDAGHIRKREERERKREKIKKKKPSRTAASFFSFMRVPPTL